MSETCKDQSAKNKSQCLLLYLLDDPRGVVARDEGEAFVHAQLAQEREELLRVCDLIAAQITVELVHQLRRFERLILARERDVEEEDRLIGNPFVFGDEREHALVARPVEFRD